MIKTLGIKQVSELTGIGLTNLYKLARTGKIPCMRVGVKYVFTEKSIEQWLNEQIESHAEYETSKAE